MGRATLERVAAYFDVPVTVFQVETAPCSKSNEQGLPKSERRQESVSPMELLQDGGSLRMFCKKSDVERLLHALNGMSVEEARNLMQCALQDLSKLESRIVARMTFRITDEEIEAITEKP